MKATTEILQNTQTGTERPCVLLQNVAELGKKQFSEEVCFLGKAQAWGLTELTPFCPQ